MFRRMLTSPLGPLMATSNGIAVTSLQFGGDEELAATTADGGADDVLDVLASQLGEYFAGMRRTFAVPLEASGTPFQQAAWGALADVGWGRTCTYGELAVKIGRPTSVRAVAAALGRNPIAIIIACHRVIGADGRLTGYAGGLERKAALLDLESALPRRAAA
ncbi:MAG: methylated-DNA--[protein]-cysteine S-methyltransferase [Nitriliruptoraceae bacterium]